MNRKWSGLVMRADRQTLIRGLVKDHAGVVKMLASMIHSCPELGFQEVKAAACQVELLRKHGFNVQSPVAGIDTAFKAVFGKGKPVLAVLSEYDALPGLGHGCGHNLISGAAVGTGLVLADLMRMQRIKGTVIVMGTPAEESKGGKILMLRRGAFRGIDCAIMGHPNWQSVADRGSTAVQRFRVEFKGKSAHAAVAPELGRNALDAVMLVFQGINAWRQQLPENARIHGIVEKGGALPNIIPDVASCRFFLRSGDDELLASMVHRFRDIVRGAALMTETRPVIQIDSIPYKSRWPNSHLNTAFMDAAARAGLEPLPFDGPARSGSGTCPARTDVTNRGSTDFGDISQIMPGGHFFFGIAEQEIPLHSSSFEQAAGSAYGMQQMLKMVETLSMVGQQYLADAGFRKKVNHEFKERRCVTG